MDANSSNLIAAIIGLITIVLAIFGASWLNSRNMERILESLRNEFRTEINRLDQRFSMVEQRLERIERQLEAIF